MPSSGIATRSNSRIALERTKKVLAWIMVSIMCVSALNVLFADITRADPPPDGIGEWRIRQDEVVEVRDDHLVITGNIIIEGFLLLDNVILEMNSTSPFKYKIHVADSGQLFVINSTIKKHDQYSYFFEVYGALNAVNSDISGLRTSGEIGGLQIGSNNVTVSYSKIHDSDKYCIFSNGGFDLDLHHNTYYNCPYGVHYDGQERPDLVGDLTFPEAIPTQGDTVPINVTVFNDKGFANNINVRVYDGIRMIENLIGEDNITTLGGMESQSVKIPWNTTGLSGNHTINVTLDVDDAINETDETNNRFNRSIFINTIPTAYADASPRSTHINDPVQFASTWTDDDDIVKYEWDFDTDGDYEHTSSTSPQTTYRYRSQGTYTATLRITDSYGATDTDSLQISVEDVPWWDDGWHFRTRIDVDAGDIDRLDTLVEKSMNFTAELGSIGVTDEELLIDSIRVVEWDNSSETQTLVPHDADREPGFDAINSSAMKLSWIVEGTILLGSMRAYYIYFDIAKNGPKADPGPAPFITDFDFMDTYDNETYMDEKVNILVENGEVIIHPDTYVETTVADFSDGQFHNTTVTSNFDGEVAIDLPAMNGTYNSSVVDTGVQSFSWNGGSFAWEENITQPLAGKDVTAYYRVSNDMTFSGVVWTFGSSDPGGFPIMGNGRYFQYQLFIQGTGTETPYVNETVLNKPSKASTMGYFTSMDIHSPTVITSVTSNWTEILNGECISVEVSADGGDHYFNISDYEDAEYDIPTEGLGEALKYRVTLFGSYVNTP